MADASTSEASTSGRPQHITLSRKDVTYLTALLRALDRQQDARARLEVGIRDARYKTGLEQRLQRLLDGVVPAKRGPKTRYTDEVMRAALEECSREACINERELAERLIDNGVLAPPVKVEWFMQRFKDWLKEHEYKLIITTHGLKYEMHAAEAMRRVEFCMGMLSRLARGQPGLNGILFGDTTTLLAVPHPKSRYTCMHPLMHPHTTFPDTHAPAGMPMPLMVHGDEHSMSYADIGLTMCIPHAQAIATCPSTSRYTALLRRLSRALTTWTTG